MRLQIRAGLLACSVLFHGEIKGAVCEWVTIMVTLFIKGCGKLRASQGSYEDPCAGDVKYLRKGKFTCEWTTF